MSPMKLVVAAVRPTLILCWRASGLASPNDVPASTLPARGIAPVRANIASRSVVLPLWKGPTSAMHRGPRGLLTSCPIAASSSGARPLIGSAGWMLPLRRRFGKPEKRRCGAGAMRHPEVRALGAPRRMGYLHRLIILRGSPEPVIGPAKPDPLDGSHLRA